MNDIKTHLPITIKDSFIWVFKFLKYFGKEIKIYGFLNNYNSRRWMNTRSKLKRNVSQYQLSLSLLQDAFAKQNMLKQMFSKLKQHVNYNFTTIHYVPKICLFSVLNIDTYKHTYNSNQCAYLSFLSYLLSY